MSLLVDSTIKVSLIGLAALVATLLLRRRPAAERHFVLAVAIACGAATPMLALVVPGWHIDVGRMAFHARAAQISTAIDVTGTTEGVRSGLTDQLSTAASTSPITGRTSTPASAILAVIWMSGAGVSVGILIVGLCRARWIAARAHRVDSGPWLELASEIAAASAIRRPQLMLSDHPRLLVTWGVSPAKVLLPASAREWPEDRRRIVLRHEFAHIRRRDWAIQILAEGLRALQWFNPIVWIVCRRLRVHSERACDDAVLSAGVRSAEYASHLLELARSLNTGRQPRLPAPAMARPSSLEGRITAMLDASIDRRPLTRSACYGIIVVALAIAIPIVSAQTAFFTVSGSILDATNRVLADVPVVLTSSASRAKYEVRSDGAGRFEFVGIPTGEYALQASQPGFATFSDTITVAGRNVDRALQMQVGSLEETILVADRPADTTRTVSPAQLEEFRDRYRLKRQQEIATCTSGPVGGHILQPAKLVDVRPIYPPQSKDAGVGGLVLIDAVIGTDGNVREARPLSSPDQALEQAAVEAVRQWQFSSTLLNCIPVEVPMRVTIRFAIAP